MDKSLLAQRYALALYEVAFEQRKDHFIFNHMQLLVENWHSLPEFKKALESPILANQEKLNLMEQSADIKKDPLCSRFFSLVLAKNRAFMLGRIARAYIDLWNERNGIVASDLITAGLISTELSERLLGVVEQAVPDKKIEMRKEINPALIGGFILQVESLRVDASVRRELEYLKMNLLQ